MAVDDVGKIKNNIRNEYSRREAKLVALSFYFAGKLLNEFRVAQAANRYWTNRTNTAYDEVFSGTIEEEGEVGIFLAHMVEYGVYLELAHDRKHEALRPIVKRLSREYFKAAAEII